MVRLAPRGFDLLRADAENDCKNIILKVRRAKELQDVLAIISLGKALSPW